ncbi:hypothetical protein GGF50DRAFT_115802 [Schizophyllum commune]
MSSRRSLSLESVSSMQSIDTVQSFDSADDVPSMNGGKASCNEHRAEGDRGTLANDGSVPSCEPEVAIGTTTASAGPPSHGVNNNGSEQEPSQTKTHPRFFLDPRTVEFVLDDGTLYRVFRYFFELHSPEFVAKHVLNDSSGPVQLSGVSGVDFDRFLSLMYPSELAGCDVKTPSEWISVLRLAIKWSFPALRARAIKEIERIGNVVDKICVAREFGGLELGEGLDTQQHDDELKALQLWLLPAFTEACTTPKWLASISLDDAERLGAATILQIGRLREELRDAGTGGEFGVGKAIRELGLAPKRAKKNACAAKPPAANPLPTSTTFNPHWPPVSAAVETAPMVHAPAGVAHRALQGATNGNSSSKPTILPTMSGMPGANDKSAPAAVDTIPGAPVARHSLSTSRGEGVTAEPPTITVSRTKWIDTMLALEAHSISGTGLAPVSAPLPPSASTKYNSNIRPSASSVRASVVMPADLRSSLDDDHGRATSPSRPELTRATLSKKQKWSIGLPPLIN